MGFGCNAAGVMGCRIIDSERERLIAILTNSFVPCNGRFPTLISIITMFFLGSSTGLFSTALSAVFLTGLILLGILMTFGASWLLSKTVLKGIPSSFALELPPYRKPQVGRVIVRSMLDRTLFALGRAAAAAAPAGLILYLLANIFFGDVSLLSKVAGFFDPFAALLGLDGVIFTAFLLGLPANEIVFPIIIMAYLMEGRIMEMESLTALKMILVQNGWTWKTALSTMVFSLFHWPCATTLMTVQKETGKFKWTLLACLLPAAIGMLLLILFNGAFRLISSCFAI